MADIDEPAVAQATKNGHDMEWDPPSGISAARRWTCREYNCSATAINYLGNIYGDAITQTHDEVIARHRRLGLTR